MLDKILSGFTKIFGSKSDRDIKKVEPIVKQINKRYEELALLSDDQLKQITEGLKERLKKATEEIDESIQTFKARLSSFSDENALTMDERRSINDELEQLEKEWLEIIEE